MSWWRALARRAYHSAPPTFWRGVDGFASDVRSLPARIRDPERRADPWETIHHVGGDYRGAGEAVVAMLRDQGGLVPTDRVLDIGCGNGRMTRLLVDEIGPEGGYVGFDVSQAAIRYCRRRFGPVRPDFRFEHLDVCNGAYNPGGRLAETQARFPCADGSITFAFATSVFTHLLPEAIDRYLAETRRVLAPGGRAVITAFLLTPQVRAWITEGRTNVALKPWRDDAMTVDLHWPEAGLAYDEPVMAAAVERAGLRLTRTLYGYWRPESTYPAGQDVLIVER